MKNHFEQIIATYLSPSSPTLANVPQRLADAINYTVLQGGKRLRPLLVYTTGLILDCDVTLLDAPACAIELIHVFSLIHDDLPGMDNDDLRRGNPTCHKKFDEATAILAGDALLSLAGTILCQEENNKLTTIQRLQALQTLYDATGPAGMIGGQMLDMLPISSINTNELENIYLLKTAALFRASVKLATIAANCHQESVLQALDNYAKYLGLAFQINDDITDKNSAEKINYVSVTNLETAQRKVQELYTQALTALEQIPYETTMLKNLATHVLAIAPQ